MNKINKIGEKNISNEGYEMKIIEYKNNKDIIVEFQDEYKNLIPSELYEALYKWEVEIND